MLETNLLETINSPSDLAELSIDSLNKLAGEIRAELIEIVSQNGGHLASNLGIVEITIALLKVFNPPLDKLIFDTSHQGYVYKMLTGRRKELQTLRQDDGCCGFLLREESEYDHFGAGHAGTAISAALGMAAARDQKGGSEKVIAICGDAALGTGVSLEGLNSIIEITKDFVFVLNDNKMSIAPNVGAISKFLNKMILGRGYNRVKKNLSRNISKLPIIGKVSHKIIRHVEEITKNALVPGAFFEELGLRYIGPLDGHDLEQLIEAFEGIKDLEQPLVLHIFTEKGRGYSKAESAPEIYHGTGSFDPQKGVETLQKAEQGRSITFSEAFGNSMINLLQKDDKTIAITAGMCHGTGLPAVRSNFPERFYDVGIAEEHAVVFAAGMATQNFIPIVVLYATFMQRALDYVFHDVCLQKLPVIFCLDRSGIVNDGATHHGVHDLSFWQSVPNITVLQPRDAKELDEMMILLHQKAVPAVIRYPKGDATNIEVPREALQWGKSETLRQGKDAVIWAVGRETKIALEVAKILAKQGVELKVVNPRFLIPFDKSAIAEDAQQMPIITLEDHFIDGGFASIVAKELQNANHNKILNLGWPCEVLPWGTVSGIRKKFKLDPPAIAQTIIKFLG